MCATYLSVVHAELPDSVPGEVGSRFQPCAYLRPEPGSKGHKVSGKFDGVIKEFVARCMSLPLLQSC